MSTPAERFTFATADATGKDERTVRRAAARGKALGDDLDAIAGTSLDKGAELDALASERQALPRPSRRPYSPAGRVRDQIHIRRFGAASPTAQARQYGTEGRAQPR